MEKDWLYFESDTMAIGGRKKLTPKPKGSKRSPSGVARTRARVVASAEKAAARKAGIAPTDKVN